jgi:hypothetical protein
MSTDVNYSIKGTTDVPEKVDKSKKAMSDFERQTAAVQKKFGDFGKDVFMSFFAPMVLLHSAINFVSAAIEARKREVKEALDFASTAEAKLYASQQEIEAAQRRKDQLKVEEDKKTAEEMKLQARMQFFREAPEGYAMVQEQLAFNQSLRQGPYGAMAMGTGMNPQTVEGIVEQLAKSNEKLSPQLQAAFDKFFAETAAQRPVKEGAGNLSAQNVAALSSNTVGVGMNAQFDILNKQVALQEDMANSLRRLVESDQGRIGFQPSKYPDFGGPTQSNRTPLPAR